MKKKKLLPKKEIAKRLLKSKSNTVFTNIEQVENTLIILLKMGALNTTEVV